jgi:ketosteroid isomerase-like protein
MAAIMSERDAILAANAAYYLAFSAGDVAAMDRIWADDGVSCVHPGWPALVGRDSVMESYRGILSSATRVRIVHRDDVAIVAGEEGRVLCVEIVEGTAVLAATNCFRRVGGVWRMTHHQASPIATPVEESRPPPRGQRLN